MKPTNMKTFFLDSPDYTFSRDDKAFIVATLNDKRSWGVPVQEIDACHQADYIVAVRSPAYIGRVYPSIGPELSLTDTRKRVIVTIFNSMNWKTIPRAAIKSGFASLRDYKTYLVNHEYGHALGIGHAVCRANQSLPPQNAPVMMQQTKGTQTCRPCVWPRLCGDFVVK